MQDLNDIFEVLSDLAEKADKIGFSETFVYGSAVNNDGDYFIKHGPDESDIDVLMVFSAECSDFLRRTEACKALARIVQKFEKQLQDKMGRTDRQKQVCVILPVTRYELFHNINEGQDNGLYRTAQFVSASSPNAEMVVLCDGHDEQYHARYNELLLAIKHAQTVRKHYVGVGVGGKRKGMCDFVSPTDAIPKRFMRRAALLSAWKSDRKNLPERTELAKGQTFIVRHLQEMAENNVDPSVSALWQTVEKRLLRRGLLPALSVDDQLLLAELTFDMARAEIPETFREKLVTMIDTDII